METIIELLKEPFAVGLYAGLTIGLLFSLAVTFSSWRKRRELRQRKDDEIRRLNEESRRLKEVFVTKEEIHDQGKQSLTRSVEELKKQNENLRVSLQTFMNEPDRAELRTFHVYYSAVRKMNKRAPGFAAAWESCLEEAESEVEQARTGLIAWVREKLHPPQLIPRELPESQEQDGIAFNGQNDEKT